MKKSLPFLCLSIAGIALSGCSFSITRIAKASPISEATWNNIFSAKYIALEANFSFEIVLEDDSFTRTMVGEISSGKHHLVMTTTRQSEDDVQEVYAELSQNQQDEDMASTTVYRKEGESFVKTEPLDMTFESIVRDSEWIYGFAFKDFAYSNDSASYKCQSLDSDSVKMGSIGKKFYFVNLEFQFKDDFFSSFSYSFGTSQEGPYTSAKGSFSKLGKTSVTLPNVSA